MIELQQKLLGDKVRNKAFFEALKKVIVPGKTVIADIGSGTGFLSFLAHKLGAKECYLYEYGDIIEISEKIAAQNGINNCHFIQAHSAEIKIPPKVDVVISETLGNYAYEENIIETLEDAKRFLKPSGIIIPQKIEQFIIPVISPRIFNEINMWESVGFDLNLDAAKEVALNNMYSYKIAPRDLLKSDNCVQMWDCVDFKKQNKSVRKGKAQWRILKDSTIYGFANWWTAHLIKGISLSSSPFCPSTHWDQIFLPLIKPVCVKKGEFLEVSLVSDSRYEIGINLSWETQGIKMNTQKGAY